MVLRKLHLRCRILVTHEINSIDKTNKKVSISASLLLSLLVISTLRTFFNFYFRSQRIVWCLICLMFKDRFWKHIWSQVFSDFQSSPLESHFSPLFVFTQPIGTIISTVQQLCFILTRTIGMWQSEGPVQHLLCSHLLFSWDCFMASSLSFCPLRHVAQRSTLEIIFQRIDSCFYSASRICRFWMIKYNLCGSFPAIYLRMGAWWLGRGVWCLPLLSYSASVSLLSPGDCRWCLFICGMRFIGLINYTNARALSDFSGLCTEVRVLRVTTSKCITWSWCAYLCIIVLCATFCDGIRCVGVLVPCCILYQDEYVVPWL